MYQQNVPVMHNLQNDMVCDVVVEIKEKELLCE